MSCSMLKWVASWRGRVITMMRLFRNVGQFCQPSGCHSDTADDALPLGYDAVSPGKRSLTCRRNIVTSSSRDKGPWTQSHQIVFRNAKNRLTDAVTSCPRMTKSLVTCAYCLLLTCRLSIIRRIRVLQQTSKDPCAVRDICHALFSEEGGSFHPPNAVCNSLATAIDKRSWNGPATICAE